MVSTTEHHQVLVTQLCADAIIFGVYATREDAEAAVLEVTSFEPSPDVYRRET